MTVQNVTFRKNSRATADADTLRRPSPDIWRDCPWYDIREGFKSGIAVYDNFERFPLIGTQTTQIGFDRYKVFSSAAGTTNPVSTINSVESPGQYLKLATDTDNDSASIAVAYPHMLLSGLTGTSGKAWFEARIAMNTILTNTIGWILGLAETEQWTLAAAVPLNASDSLNASASFIGFRKEEDGLGVIDTGYSDRATSLTNVGDAATSVSEAYEFIKLGMRYDPENVDECITFYANNIKLADVVSRSTLTGLTNLDANCVAPIFAMVADSAGTSGECYLDWWRWAQELPITQDLTS